MLSRSMQTSVIGRNAAVRRNRRRLAESQRPYCRTNGCASFLELDAEAGRAICPVCGYTRRLD